MQRDLRLYPCRTISVHEVEQQVDLVLLIVFLYCRSARNITAVALQRVSHVALDAFTFEAIVTWSIADFGTLA